MHGSNIAPEIIQDVLESASNASSKGLSQFFTPLEFGKAIAFGLTKHRGCVVDLNCGDGALLQACANESTTHLLGCDIDPCKWKRITDHKCKTWKINCDLTLLYDYLCDTGFKTNLFVLNPPWDLHWKRDRLQGLLESYYSGVVKAFKRFDPRLSSQAIDSTVATMMIAIDRMSYSGEGVCIANYSTIRRLILDSDAPHSDLQEYISGIIKVKGNPMTGIDDCSFVKDKQFYTAVVYLSTAYGGTFKEHYAESIPEVGREASRIYAEQFHGYGSGTEVEEKWLGVSDEISKLDKPRTDYNLWLKQSGEIGVHLSLYQTFSGKVDKQLAHDLFEFNGKRPEQLVMQASQRKRLNDAVTNSPWRIDPKLQEAVQVAIGNYHKDRTPLVALPKIQRLGYLDEQDTIKCVKQLDGFYEGCAYSLSSMTVFVTRNSKTMNVEGQSEDILLHGSELIFMISDESGNVKIFMDSRLNNEDVSINGGYKMDYTLEQLCDHFEIPEVPDVASAYPEKYEANKQTILKIFAAINS